ncbi:heme peroxidase family protein [Leptolyngbya sp. ST-U4]|uniref:peroxidase family protein n=1 Tax=Leptolyngbya sp. ST-U4 TaxID=2933912 RepID=UPI001983A351|nr:peroxidase [Cyanobacteria bacterium FACHB-502]
MQTIVKQSFQDVPMFEDSLYRSFMPMVDAVRAEENDFSKLFPCLPSFAEGQNRQDVLQRLRILGKKGGLMDAQDPLVTITNPLDGNPTRNPDNKNPEMTVGFTFLGQFLDHDITFDPLPLTSTVTNSKNLRSPFFDLDSVYGRGPDIDSILYDRSPELQRPAPTKFLIDMEAARDLPRTSQQRAIIADPRNDENVIISQLHLAFLKFHNQVIDYVVEQNPANSDPKRMFEEARRLVRWHYQYIIVNQFLKATLDPVVYEQVKKNGPTIFQPSAKPKMPREFQISVYRFGHSQIRPGYKPNQGFGAPIFDPVIDPQDGDPNDLRGGRRAPRRFVEWDIFFDFGVQEVAVRNGQAVVQPRVKPNKRIDPFISSPMFDLPVGPGLPDPVEDVRTLAGRNLERHLQHGIPSGQAIAQQLGYAPLTPEELAELRHLNFHRSTPLWYYILKEALVQQGGQRLGQVGSRIIAEVFFGLLLSDSSSYWSQKPTWTPTLPRRNGRTDGNFTMVDLLTFARVA